LDWYRWDGDDLLLELRVQPRAARDELIGPLGTALKVRITAPPVEGKANAHLLRWLADLFGVPQAQVTLLSGDGSRGKRVRIRAPQRLPQLAPDCRIDRPLEKADPARR
jgi:uncharacterized protein (TIGR00251 family)